MKELYTSPEMKLISFVSAEKLASDSISFDDLLGKVGLPGSGDSASVAAGDLDLPQLS